MEGLSVTGHALGREVCKTNFLSRSQSHLEYCSKLCKCTVKSVCVHGISYSSVGAFLCQRAGTARKRSWFACMGDSLFKLLCLYRIFNVEYSSQGFIKMLDCTGNEKSPNCLLNSNKNLSFLIVKMFY